MSRGGYINVDQLQAATSLDEAAAKCGVSLDAHGDGKEIHLDCPFACEGDHSGRREIAVNTENDQKVFMCHAYQCGFRGNLLTLMHGWLAGSRPTGEKLKGEEFHRVKNVLANVHSDYSPAERVASPRPAVEPIAQTPTAINRSPAGATTTKSAPSPLATTPATASDPECNVPLGQSGEEKVRELTTLDDKFVLDVAAMPPPAASYVRRHPCLSPESMKKWRVGVLPMDGGSDKRGFSLRGQVVYPVPSEDGQVLAWIGRDPKYEEKERDFSRLTPAERTEASAPMKHRFPKGFHRGLELFGQQASRLNEPGYREAIARHGLIVVEGFNDVIGLDNLGIPAIAIMSNRITEAQVEKITRWSRQLTNGKVTLLFDCEPTGDDGAKEALWLLAERGLNTRLGWSQAMHSGTFQGRQPENLTREEWEAAILPILER
ncbi:MAG: toprim domain-containing protein [Planctomycetota bacterium]